MFSSLFLVTLPKSNADSLYIEGCPQVVQSWHGLNFERYFQNLYIICESIEMNPNFKPSESTPLEWLSDLVVVSLARFVPHFWSHEAWIAEARNEARKLCHRSGDGVEWWLDASDIKHHPDRGLLLCTSASSFYTLINFDSLMNIFVGWDIVVISSL